MSINPFFGRWHPITSVHFQSYSILLDLLAGQRFTKPLITKDGTTYPANYFLDESGKKCVLTQENFPPTAIFIHANSVHGNILLVANTTDYDTLFLEGYRLLAKGYAPSLRELVDADRQVHWVWFRKTRTWRIYDEIVWRAASWIELNPGYTFHLWTNLADAAEQSDFLADLSVSLRTRYFDSGAIRVHYADEFRKTIFDWLSANVNAETIEIFARVWESTERQDTVMKTDYTRNILLAVHGGIYSDFNDLVCLTPIEPLLQTHAGNWIGVTDNLSDSNASNYFMYAGVGNPEWAEITVRCTETLTEVYNTIHCRESFEIMKTTLATILANEEPNLDFLQRHLDACPLKSPFIQLKHWFYTLCGAVEFALGPSNAAGEQIRTFLRPNTHNRMKPVFISNCMKLLCSLKDSIVDLLVEGDTRFEEACRFMRTDMYLNTIMHRSNLPIYCRQTNRTIYLLPFSYLLRYACLFSFVGHLGDGSSYGMDPARRITIKSLLGCE